MLCGKSSKINQNWSYQTLYEILMVKAYKSMKFFLLYNNVLALEDILLLIVHGHILINVVYDHDLLMLFCLYILLSSYYVGNKLSI
jgi:hypothetical protein